MIGLARPVLPQFEVRLRQHEATSQEAVRDHIVCTRLWVAAKMA